MDERLAVTLTVAELRSLVRVEVESAIAERVTRPAPASSPSDLLTTEEACKVLRVTRRTLYRWISVGKLRAMKSDPGGAGRVFVQRRAVEALIASWNE
jgi:excisionase family DNA binding protein